MAKIIISEYGKIAENNDKFVLISTPMDKSDDHLGSTLEKHFCGTAKVCEVEL